MKGNWFIQNKIKTASRVSSNKSAVVYSSQLLFKSTEKKFSFRRVESQELRSHLSGKTSVAERFEAKLEYFINLMTEGK